MEAIGSNGFPTSYVPPSGTSAILDVKPLRTLSPMALHPFMPMPGYGPGSFPFMGFNPYCFYPPGAPPGFPGPIPPFAHQFPQPTTVASPEPVTPVAKVHEALHIDEPPASPPKAHPSNRRQQSKTTSRSAANSAKRKTHKKGNSSASQAEVSDRKASSKKVKIDAPSPLCFETNQPATLSGRLRSSSRKPEIDTPSPLGSRTKQPATRTGSLRSSKKPKMDTASPPTLGTKLLDNRAGSLRSSSKKPEIDNPSPLGRGTKRPANLTGSVRSSSKKPEIITSSAPVGETKKGCARASSCPSSTPSGTGKTSRKRKKKATSGGKSKRKAASAGKSTNKEVLPLHVTSNLTGQESAEKILMIFDAIRRRVCQAHDVSLTGSGIGRPDLIAFTTMTSNGLKVNREKRIGNVPGVYVGDVFHFRLEMCLVGLHTPPMAGIDSMLSKFGEVEDPVAMSIVSSGGYEGDVDEGDVLIYSGQGGSSGKDGKQVNQKLERGNLALDRSLRHAVDIRVTRGVKDPRCPTGKMYIYDGLYKIRESWVDQEKGGCVFKYKLIREPGQPPLGSLIWKQAQTWKENPASRNGIIATDLSAGMEKTPICLVNEVDDEKVPPDFLYISRVKYEQAISLMKRITGCKCGNACLPSGSGCDCTKLNNGEFPYIANGILVSQKPVIYECGPSCPCGPDCLNRVTQNGVKFQFEVFKTKDRGWGLRSWDPIRAGSFVCEYIGDVISRSMIDEENYDDEYIFDPDRDRENSLEWDGMYELLGESRPAQLSQDFKQLPTVIDAKRSGNLSRFMNHSCSPNVFCQHVLYDHGDEGSPHIMFFARKNIPPMMELTYDYGRSKLQPGKESRRRKCLCGSSNCKGYFA